MEHKLYRNPNGKVVVLASKGDGSNGTFNEFTSVTGAIKFLEEAGVEEVYVGFFVLDPTPLKDVTVEMVPEVNLNGKKKPSTSGMESVVVLSTRPVKNFVRKQSQTSQDNHLALWENELPDVSGGTGMVYCAIHKGAVNEKEAIFARVGVHMDHVCKECAKKLGYEDVTGYNDEEDAFFGF